MTWHVQYGSRGGERAPVNFPSERTRPLYGGAYFVVPGSNLCPETGFPGWHFRSFTKCPRFTGMVSQIRSRTLPNTSFVVHRSSLWTMSDTDRYKFHCFILYTSLIIISIFLAEQRLLKCDSYIISIPKKYSLLSVYFIPMCHQYRCNTSMYSYFGLNPCLHYVLEHRNFL